MTKKLPLALVGCNAPESVFSNLSALGFKVITLAEDKRLATPVASHADMIVFRINDRIFCSSDYNCDNSVFKAISNYGYTVVKCDCEISDKYPHDIAFNLAVIGNKIYGKTDFSAREILDYAENKSIERISVKQGYTKCSTVVLGDNAIITADESIAARAKENQISVLKTENSPSAVSISGYDYGFLGGACGVFKNKVYFTGNISGHPNGCEIESFCKFHGFDIVSVYNGILTDIGGIIFLEPLS